MVSGTRRRITFTYREAALGAGERLLTHATGGWPRAVGSRPSGGEPSSNIARWKRWSEKPAPHSSRARSRNAHDLQLPVRVAAIGRVEDRATGLRACRRARQVRVGGEPPRALLDRHARSVHADRAGQPRHADERLQPHPDLEPRVVGHEALFDAELLGVVRPPLDERQGVQRPAYGGRRAAQRAAVGEVPGRDLVHRDAGSVVALNTCSQSSMSSAGQPGSGGVMWYHDGASGSPGAAHDIIAMPQRRDSGAGPTRHSPSW